MGRLGTVSMASGRFEGVRSAGSGSLKSSWCDLLAQEVFRNEQNEEFRKQLLLRYLIQVE